MRRILCLVIALIISALFVPVNAHHAFSAEFDASKVITLRGTVTKMDWVNPHSWLWVDVKGDDGKVVNWGFELGSPANLLRRGWKKDSIKVGTELVITGYLARSGLPRANGRDVKLPNGQEFFAASSINDDAK